MTKECESCYKDIDISDTQCPHCGAVLRKTDVPDLILIDRATSSQIIICSETILSRPDATIILGREGDICPEFFKNCEKISRKHCMVVLDKTDYKIEHMPTATNPTKINNKPLTPGIKAIIRDGNTLTLADKDFCVSMVAPKKEETTSEQPIIEYELVIICPKCGTKYPVDGEDAKVLECDNCNPLNKGRIAKIKAQKVPKNAS